jgi:hypothetical protein
MRTLLVVLLASTLLVVEARVIGARRRAREDASLPCAAVGAASGWTASGKFYRKTFAEGMSHRVVRFPLLAPNQRLAGACAAMDPSAPVARHYICLALPSLLADPNTHGSRLPPPQWHSLPQQRELLWRGRLSKRTTFQHARSRHSGGRLLQVLTPVLGRSTARSMECGRGHAVLRRRGSERSAALGSASTPRPQRFSYRTADRCARTKKRWCMCYLRYIGRTRGRSLPGCPSERISKTKCGEVEIS